MGAIRVLLVVLVVVTAGCGGLIGDPETEGTPAPDTPEPDGEATPEPDGGEEGPPRPAVERVGLLGEGGAISDLDSELSSVDAPSDAVLGAVYRVPVHNGSFDAAVEVTVYREGQAVASETVRTGGTVDGANATRYTWVSFGTVDWEQGDHSAEVVVRDRETNATSEAAAAEFEVTRQYTDDEIARLDAYNAWGDTLAEAVAERGLNVTDTQSSVGDSGERVTLIVRLGEGQRFTPAAAETANAAAVVTDEIRGSAEDPFEPDAIRVRIADADGELVGQYEVRPDLAGDYLAGETSREAYADATVGGAVYYRNVDEPADPAAYLRAAELRAFAAAYEAVVTDVGSVGVNDTHVSVDDEEVRVHAFWPGDEDRSAHPGMTTLISGYWRTMLVAPDRHHPESGLEFYLTNGRPVGEDPIGSDARAFLPTDGAENVVDADEIERIQATFAYRGLVFEEHYEPAIADDVNTGEPVEEPYEDDERSLRTD